MTSHQELVIGIGLLALFGLFALIASSRRKAKRAAEAARESARAISLFGRVLISAAVITGIQFLVIRFAHNTTLVVCVLAVPALLAAATAVRALTVTTFSTGRRGGHR